MIAHDIHSFLTLSNQLQIHENAIEIGLNLKQGFKGAKYPIIFGSEHLRISLKGQISYKGYYQELPRPSTYLNQFLIQPHPHFSATVNIYMDLIKSL